MEPIVRFPHINNNYQEIIVNEFEKIYSQAREISIDHVKKKAMRMTPDRMLQFVLLIIFQMTFGLTKSGTFSLFSSGKVDLIKNYIKCIDKKFPGGSTFIKRVPSIRQECESELTCLARRVQDGFYSNVGNQAREAFSVEYRNRRIAMTPPPECFIGLVVPSKLFPDLTVEERGILIPFFNAKMLMHAKRISGISELVGEIKTPSFNGTTTFPLASKLGFFGGPPRSNAFYDVFRDLERMAVNID